ncbi:MAG: hypothetical protein HYZ29_28025 [Myxococcales bacterium]|nr:hypothetical protein [Myxococcales bacterium]
MSTSARKRSSTTGAALAKAVAEFDDELVVDTFGPPTADARARWENAKRRRGRPRTGRGARVISVSVERSLLERSDAVARRLDLTRAELIARGLRAVLAVEGER